MLCRTLGLVAATIFTVVVSQISASTAEPYALKCTTEKDNRVEELKSNITVDLNLLILTIGDIKFGITNITSRYITAFQKNSIDPAPPQDPLKSDGASVGGDIFVLDRLTGNYKWATVAITCDWLKGENVDVYCKNRWHLEALTHSGRCVRPIL
jgi:hypothetical protein